MKQRWAWTHRYAVPLFVTSLVAVVLAGAGLVGALIAFQGGGGDRAGGPPAGSTGGPTGQGTAPADPPAGNGPEDNGPADDGPEDGAGVDDCLVGRWQLISHEEEVRQLDGQVDEVTLRSGNPVLELRADGTGKVDHGDGTRMEGDRTVADITGEINFDYEASEGRINYLDYDSDATLTLEVDGLPLGEQPARLSTDPFSYECAGDTLTFEAQDGGTHSEYTRLE